MTVTPGFVIVPDPDIFGTPRTPLDDHRKQLLRTLRDRRLEVWRNAVKIAETAAAENRAFTAEEKAHWDNLYEYLQELDRKIQVLLQHR